MRHSLADRPLPTGVRLQESGTASPKNRTLDLYRAEALLCAAHRQTVPDGDPVRYSQIELVREA